MLNWGAAVDYKNLLSKSAEVGKPILLDLYSSQCKGCLNLDQNIYKNEDVAKLINEHTIPLRVFTDNPDRDNVNLINNHIYIWSPTVQLLSSNGSRYHEWYGAPRQTRYSMGYQQTHHEVDGDMTAPKFMSQFYVALGKAALKENNFEKSIRYFEKVIAEYPNIEISIKEAGYWLNVAKNKGQILPSTKQLSTMTRLGISESVEQFIKVATKFPDLFLLEDWKGETSHGDWEWYTDSLKEVCLQIFQQMNDFSNHVSNERKINNNSQTTVHAMLTDFHMAYREFQSTLIGVRDADLDLTPFTGERSLRENLVHCILSEWWAHSPQIKFALKLKRANKTPELMPGLETLSKYGEPVGTFETLNELLSRYESLHNNLIDEFSSIAEEEADAFSQWWEPKPVEISFRLKRLGWHLRDHKITLEKILQSIGHKRTEIERFCQLIISGLAKAESALIGAPSEQFQFGLQKLDLLIRQRTKELQTILDMKAKQSACQIPESMTAT